MKELYLGMTKFTAITAALLSLPGAFAQTVLSVRSGLVHYVEGDVLLDNGPVNIGKGKFPMVAEGKVLATASDGRAEVLLTPGAFVRMAGDSSLTMVSSTLAEAKVEVLTGSALVEVAQLSKVHSLSVRMGEADIALLKPGLYLFDMQKRAVRVYEGKARMIQDDVEHDINKGRQGFLGAEATTAKFDVDDTGVLHEWSKRRSHILANANLVAAGELHSAGFRGTMSGWTWCPGPELFTYLPYAGFTRSPFGYAYYTPKELWRYHASQQVNKHQESFANSRAGSPWTGFGSEGGIRAPQPVNAKPATPTVNASDGAIRSAAPPTASAQTNPAAARR